MSGESFDNRNGKIWYNGKMVEWRDANLHLLSHGLHYGSSVFEGARAYNQNIFKLEAHTERLFFSANGLVDINTCANFTHEFCILSFSAHLAVYIAIDDSKSLYNVTISPNVLEVQMLFLFKGEESIV